MRPNVPLSCALVFATAASSWAGVEGLRASAERQFQTLPELAWPKLVPSQRPAPAEETQEPLIQDPRLRLLDPQQALGAVVGRVALSGQLDRHRDLITRQLGISPWTISTAGDSAFKNAFLTFQQAPKLVISPLGDLKRLRGEGIDVAIEPGLIYNFRVSINIFNPVRGSTLEIKPSQGTRGPRHNIKTGVILDAIKAKSYVFKADGIEYWMLYGTDVDPATNTLAQTRSLAFIHENGTSSKAWPIAESALPVGQPAQVSFGDNRYVLLRTAEGELLIRKP